MNSKDLTCYLDLVVIDILSKFQNELAMKYLLFRTVKV